VAAAGLALVVLLALVTSGALARPLERLAAQAKALPAGDVRSVGGGAELDHLVEAMNRMVAEVRRSERLGVMGQMAAGGRARDPQSPLLDQDDGADASGGIEGRRRRSTSSCVKSNGSS
jgi:HAMP domain-containing protein